jgi:hypothetical protein
MSPTTIAAQVRSARLQPQMQLPSQARAVHPRPQHQSVLQPRTCAQTIASSTGRTSENCCLVCSKLVLPIRPPLDAVQDVGVIEGVADWLNLPKTAPPFTPQGTHFVKRSGSTNTVLSTPLSSMSFNRISAEAGSAAPPYGGRSLHLSGCAVRWPERASKNQCLLAKKVSQADLSPRRCAGWLLCKWIFRVVDPNVAGAVNDWEIHHASAKSTRRLEAASASLRIRRHLAVARNGRTEARSQMPHRASNPT